MSEYNDIYWVCLPLREGTEPLRGDLCRCRKSFFEHGRSAVRLQKEHCVKGFDGKVRGKISRRSFFWEKTVRGSVHGKAIIEEGFTLFDGWLLVTRDLRGIIISRVYFDKQHRWLRSDYYEPWDSSVPRISFRADERGLISRFDLDGEKNDYKSAPLYPAPYRCGTAEQSLVDAQLGAPQLVLLTDKGEMCFCFESEAEERKQALNRLSEGKIMLMPAWEVREGKMPKEEPGASITFTSLEEYAKIEPEEEEEQVAAGPSKEHTLQEVPAPADTQEITDTTPAVQTAEISAAAADTAEQDHDESQSLPQPDDASLQEDDWDTDFQPPSPRHAMGEPEAAVTPGTYRGEIQQGSITGRGRVEQPSGLTSYDGEYLEGKRHGFGAYYYKDGNLCYAGGWKDDRREGPGVSFRDSDHAMHVANWSNGQPQGLVTLFDSSGNLRYSGIMNGGKKEGAGVMINGGDGSVFVGQYSAGEATGLGSSFDPQGRLLYYGCWKDGKRHGHGTEFDLNGGVVFDGEFREDKYYNGVLYKKLENPPLE